MENKRKIAAAISGVMNYIAAEEEAIYIQSMSARAAAPSGASYVSAPMKLWGVSGRQAQMQMRNMMQMRTFK